MTDTASSDLTELTVELLSAFVANNNVRSDDLPGLIASTHAALAGLSGPGSEPVASAETHSPAVTGRNLISKSVFFRQKSCGQVPNELIASLRSADLQHARAVKESQIEYQHRVKRTDPASCVEEL